MNPRAPRRPVRRGRRGSALVELALVMPMLLALLIGLMEFGILGMRKMTLIGAVRAGVEFAAQNGADSAGTERTVRSAAGNDAAAVSTSRFCECGGTVVTCGGLCGDGTAQQIYVRVAAQEIYVPIFLSHGMIESLLGPTSTVAANATFRFQ